ncbi:MAG: CRISPR-associated endonuclease Cas1, partial [Armatimonadetes bacterium]|nr:CRISPR-associated endonuclease Cas1 [Armatimonadota bacterium]
MAVLYVTQPGAELRKQSGRLRVLWKGQLLSAIPLKDVERVMLLGPVQVSAAASHVLLRERVPVLYGSTRGRLYGSLMPGYQDVEQLLIQVARYQDPAYRLQTARAVVSAKIHHQRGLLRRQARNHPHPALTEAADQLSMLLSTLDRRASVAEVMGVEGQASAFYFAVFGLCLRQEGVAFSGRNRRPPRDPVNALLSLGYMLLLGEVVSALLAQGLHIGIGFLHEVSSRRPALALDVLEVGRQPIVDRLTLSLFNLRIFDANCFQPTAQGGVLMKPESLKRYLLLFERAMMSPFTVPHASQQVTFRALLR